MNKDVDSLLNMYTRFAFSTVPQRRNRELALLSLNQLGKLSEEEKDVAWLAHVAQRCPAYRISQPVLNATEKLIKNTYLTEPEKREKFHSAIRSNPELIRPPFGLVWFEWEGELNGINRKMGILINDYHEETGGGIGFYVFGWGTNNGIFPSTHDEIMWVRVFSDMRAEYIRDDALTSEEFKKGLAQHYAVLAPALLMIMKSRTPIFKVQEPDVGPVKTKMLNHRFREGKPTNRPLGDLTFDVSRILSKGRASSTEEAERLLEEIIVCGHFKLIQMRNRDEHGEKVEGTSLQLAWWSPHFRFGTEEQKSTRSERMVVKPRDANTVIRSPERPLIIPGIDVEFPKNNFH